MIFGVEQRALAAGRPVARRGTLIAALWLSACAPRIGHVAATSSPVRVRGTVFDSLTRALCGSTGRSDDVAIAGVVRNAATHEGLDSARVYVNWVDLTLSARGVTRSTETHVATTTSDGSYVSCGVPAEATVLVWAERGGATTGAVPLTLASASARFDMSLDTTARPSTTSLASLQPEPDSTGTIFSPSSAGTARLHVLVRDVTGHAVSNARVRILGRSTARSDAGGVVTFDSIAGGTQTLEVLSIGFQPERQTVDVAVGREMTDTVVVAALETVLDAVQITASRDPTGFELRRETRKGQFITAADVARENPVHTTNLLRSRPGLRYTFDRNGYGFIEVTTLDKPCRPLILVDGFPPGAAPSAMGQAVLDWLVHPEEIGGVEIYTTPDQVPPEFARFAFGPPCAAIVFWTREELGLPKPNHNQP